MKIILSCNGITCILLKLVFHITIFMAEVKKYPNVIFFQYCAALLCLKSGLQVALLLKHSIENYTIQFCI